MQGDTLVLPEARGLSPLKNPPVKPDPRRRQASGFR